MVKIPSRGGSAVKKVDRFTLAPKVHLSLSVLEKQLKCTQLFSKKWLSH